MNLTSVKLTGNPGPSGWSQVHDFTPQDAEKLKLRGRFFAVVATQGETGGVDSVSVGRELLARLHEEYFGKLETTPFNALRLALENVISEFVSTWGKIEIAAACVLEDAVYSAATGGAEVAILRGGAFAKILISSSAAVSSVSGYPKDGDFLIFGSRKFFDAAPPQNLKEALAAGSLKVAAETLAPLIHSRSDSGDVGATILHFQKEAPKAVAGEAKPTVNVSRLLTEARTFLSKLIKTLPERKIYVKPDAHDLSASNNRRTTLSVGAIILALLVVSIVFGIKQKKNKDLRGRYEDRLVQAEHSYEEAVSLTALNSERSRELFLEAKTLATNIKDEGVKDKRLEALLEKISGSQGSILGEYKDEPELFLDLSLLTSGAKGDDLAASGGNLFILDKEGKRVVKVAIETKKTETVAGPDQMTLPQSVAGYEDHAFVVEESGIFEVVSGRTEALEDTWEGEILTHVFAANFYVLEKATGPEASGPEGRGVIWRYPGSGESTEPFGAKQNWFGEGVSPNFSNAVSMAIDGSIWVLNSDGRILKFAQGSPQAFSPQGVTPAVTNAEAIHTNEENNFVYVLDRAGKRVIVLQKDGKYKAQYVSDKIGEATDLVVSEKDGKIILLAGSKLYSLAVKHL